MGLENYESMEFRKYTFKSELDKAMHTLEGILKGIVIDNRINRDEYIELKHWYNQYGEYVNMHPFSEIIPQLRQAFSFGKFELEDIEGILWLCNNLKTDNEYFDLITSDIQRMHGILHGILSDNVITQDEIIGLQHWLCENEHLIKSYPYDEIYSLIAFILSDGVVTEEEKNMLKRFFSDFIDLRFSVTLNATEIERLKQDINIKGVCCVSPDIVIPNSVFCFTGASSKTTRKGISDIINSLGGRYHDSVVKETNYLVIGNEGNPCWTFSCYGRKVEKAINLRKSGKQILIVHENDFWNSLNRYVAQCSENLI